MSSRYLLDIWKEINDITREARALAEEAEDRLKQAILSNAQAIVASSPEQHYRTATTSYVTEWQDKGGTHRILLTQDGAMASEITDLYNDQVTMVYLDQVPMEHIDQHFGKLIDSDAWVDDRARTDGLLTLLAFIRNRQIELEAKAAATQAATKEAVVAKARGLVSTLFAHGQDHVRFQNSERRVSGWQLVSTEPTRAHPAAGMSLIYDEEHFHFVERNLRLHQDTASHQVGDISTYTVDNPAHLKFIWDLIGNL